MEFAIGIITYERPEYVRRLLDSLLAQTRPPDGLVLVDDSDDDRTERIVERYRAEFEADDTTVTNVRGETKAGQPAARNRILEETDCDVLCFLDDDVEAKPGWLAAIAEGYEERLAAVAVGGPAISVDEAGEPHLELVRDEASLNRMTKYGEVRSRSGRWVPPRPVETEVLIGANMSFRADALRAIGGFDLEYRGNGFFEEWDVFARLRRDGRCVLYHPEAYVSHFQAREGGSHADLADNSDAYYWMGRNLVHFRRKNFPDTFAVGLLRALAANPHSYFPPALWEMIVGIVTTGNYHRLWLLRGYADGLLRDR